MTFTILIDISQVIRVLCIICKTDICVNIELMVFDFLLILLILWTGTSKFTIFAMHPYLNFGVKRFSSEGWIEYQYTTTADIIGLQRFTRWQVTLEITLYIGFQCYRKIVKAKVIGWMNGNLRVRCLYEYLHNG